MTPAERVAWLTALETEQPIDGGRDADEAKALADRASRWAIPDLTRFMLATGIQIGVATAVTWDGVDLDACTVAIC